MLYTDKYCEIGKKCKAQNVQLPLNIMFRGNPDNFLVAFETDCARGLGRKVPLLGNMRNKTAD